MATNFDFSWYEKNQQELIGFLNNNTNTLKSPYKQPDGLITYSFYTDSITLPQDRYSYLPTGESGKTTPFTEIEKQAFRTMVEYVSRFIDLEFLEVTAGTGDIRILHANTTEGGYASYPHGYESYQVLVVSDREDYLESRQFLSTLWHEFGHNLGLKHPNSYNESDNGSNLPDSLDSRLLSIESYNVINGSINPEQITFAPLDLQALREKYGSSKRDEGIYWRLETKSFQDEVIGHEVFHHLPVQNYENNEFTLEISRVFKEKITSNQTRIFNSYNHLWLYGTTSQDTLDASNIIETDYQTGLIIDLKIGTIISNMVIEALNYDIFDFKGGNTNEVLIEEGTIGVRIFPEKDLGKRIDSLILTSKSDSIILGDYIENIYAREGDDNFYGFSTNTIDGGDGFDTWDVGDALSRYQIKILPVGFSLASTSSEEISYFKDIEKITFLDTSFTVESNELFQQLTNSNDFFDLNTAKYNVDALMGNDVFKGYSASSLNIDGGDGFDLWSIETTYKSFKIAQTELGIEVQNTLTKTQNVLKNIELLDFIDSKFIFEQSDVSKQAYRIYKAAFDRTPDLEGVGYWINDIKNGASLETVARGFIASKEFLLRYGSNTNDNEFIKLLYENVLDRQPDSAGYQYWQNDMSNGMTREKMLINFSESQENINNVSAVIQGGVLYMDWIT